jgi:thioredoxin reductase
MAEQVVDVVVVGGGAAGLQAALVLGRARRSVIVIDGGQPRNAPAEAVHNMLGHEGVAPGELLGRGRADAERYGVEVVSGAVIDARRVGSQWRVGTADGSWRRCRALLLASGVVEDLPPIDGLADLWGRDVVGCPYCHGWEARDRSVAVLGSGPRAWRLLVLLMRFTRDLVLLGNGPSGLDDAQLGYLARTGVEVCEHAVRGVEARHGRLTAVRFDTGAELCRERLFVVTQRSQPSDLAVRLGCAIISEGPTAPAVDTDPSGRTSVPGVWAVGSSANPALTVMGAAGHATTVAIELNNALIDDEVSQEMRAHPAYG